MSDTPERITPTSNLPVFFDAPTTVTLKLTPLTVHALERAARAPGSSRTDVVNRAIQLYGYIIDALGSSADSSLIIERNGRQERVTLG